MIKLFEIYIQKKTVHDIILQLFRFHMIVAIICFAFLMENISLKTCFAAEKKKSIKITNISNGYVLPVNKSVTLKVSGYSSKAAKKNLIFRSSNKKIVKINKAGRIIGKKRGKAYITVINRGHSGIAPENTRAAFKLAASNASFDAVECDIYRTKDGVYVIQHDASLKRIFGVNKNIRDCTYNEIKDLTATGGAGVGSYPSEDVRPCLLTDYLSILKNSSKRAVIELKETYSQEGMDKLYDLISRIHNAGLKIGVYTVDKYEQACHYIFDMGVDCLTSNQALFKE